MKNKLLFLGSLLFLSSCFLEKVDIPEEVEGLAPIYGPATSLRSIETLEPQSIENLFRIYYKDPYIFAGELGRGIHIIDNTDATNPKKIAFLQIAGNSDVAIKGDLLYANNLNDLVVLNISDINNIQLVNRIENAFEGIGISDVFPSEFFGFFECPDPEQGVVIGWERRILTSPQCWR
ncbi:MAG: hypothetical protein AAF798_19310 [Bacteroidota bacterium]